VEDDSEIDMKEKARSEGLRSEKHGRTSYKRSNEVRIQPRGDISLLLRLPLQSFPESPPHSFSEKDHYVFNKEMPPEEKREVVISNSLRDRMIRLEEALLLLDTVEAVKKAWRPSCRILLTMQNNLISKEFLAQ
jgi:hypothetical protein